MKRNKTTYYYLLLMLLFMGKITTAQIRFHQSFKNPQVLQNPEWEIYSAGNVISRDLANGYAGSDVGSLKMGFHDARVGDIDSLKTPVFDPTVLYDSLFFDHAHAMAPSRNGDKDSMDILYSTDGGVTFSFLIRYVADPTPVAGSLSTLPVLSSVPRGGFTPNLSSDWASKSVELPVGTNRLAFVFYTSAGDNLYLDNLLVGTLSTICSGTPLVSNLTGTIVRCSGNEFYLAPDTFEYNPDIVYQWEQSSDNGILDPWVNVTSGNGYNSAEFIDTYLSPMYYRLTATCATSTLSFTTTSMLVTNDSSYNCICKKDFGGSCGFSPFISNVSFPSGTLNNSSLCNSSADHGAYTDFTTSTFIDTITEGNPAARISITHNNVDAKVYMWVDYNRNGSFDKEEYYKLSSDAVSGVTNTYTFRVPQTVNPGIATMRIRTVTDYSSGLDSADACISAGFNSGETEDYLVYLNPAPVCNGVPVAGVLNIAGSYNVCAGDKIVLNTSGATYGNGITYSWEESDDNGVLDPWTTVTTGVGINDVEFYPSPILDTIYYRLKVMCSNTNDSAYSTVATINTNPIYECYCQSGIGGAGCDPGNPYISLVSVSGKLINNTSACSNNNNNYSYYGFATNAYDTLHRGEEVILQVQSEIAPTATGVWIDYNQDGIYSNNEFTSISLYSTPGQPDTVHLFIPNDVSVLSGYTGMRIRTTTQGLSDADACSNYYWGETEDYVVYMDDAPLCFGSVSAGVNQKDTVMLCSGDSAKLVALGATYGDGIQYTWEQSLDAGVTDPWVFVSTGSGYDSRVFTSEPLTDTIYYRLTVTCTNTGSSIQGNPIMIGINPFYQCYCSNNLGGGGSDACNNSMYITNVSIVDGDLNNGSGCRPDPVNGNYVWYAPVGTATDTVYAGGIYNFSIETAAGTDGQAVGMWLDFDRNLVFDDYEYQLVTSNTLGGIPSIVSVVIPANVDTGYIGIRVRMNPTLDPTDACTAIVLGETEDYTLYIQQTPLCTGTPAAGDIGRDIIVCPNIAFDMSASNADYGTGISYQWEESDDNGVLDPWEPALNAVSGSDTTRFIVINGIASPKYYRFKDSCSGSNMVNYSASKYVGIDSFYSCYTQTANFGGDCDQHIANVELVGTTLNNASACNTTATNGTYSKFAPTGSATTTVIKGRTYDLAVLPSGFSSQNVGVWIDYNQNGHYETNEFTNIGNGNNRGAATGSVYIKPYAPVGYTGMRIRSRIQGFVLAFVNADDTTATYGGPGETEDYVIYIDTLSPASNVVLSNITADTIDVSWTGGNGDGVVVIGKNTTTTLVPPVDGTDYHADNSWIGFNADSTGTGNYVLYNGADTFFTAINLDLLTDYDFYVYEYVGHGPDIKYSSVPAFATGTTLPVKLTHFIATISGKNALLNWSTASEQQNAGFDVERSFDGKTFTKIGFVKGKGNSNTLNDYSFVDENVINTQNTVIYYRLKQLDNNGVFTYSKTVYVTTNKNNITAVVYPNPFTNKLSIQFNADFIGKMADVSVYDMLGVLVKNKLITIDKSSVAELDHLEELPNSVYLVKVEVNGITQTYRIMKGE